MAEPENVPTLAELASDIILLVLGFRERADSVDFNTLHQGVLKLFEEFDQKAKSFKFDSDAVADSRYALAAFVDEAVLRSQWEGKEQWADNPLQLQFFETYLAGEGFFERLDSLRTRGESAAEVIEIYYLCLILGFEGKYGIEGAERLEALAKVVHDELARFRPQAPLDVSSHWKVLDGPAREETRLPRWLIYSCAAVILVCVLLYIGFFIGILSAAGDLQNEQRAAVLLQAEQRSRLTLC